MYLALATTAASPAAPVAILSDRTLGGLWRRLYRRRFRGHATLYNCDRYLPAAWQPEPRFGLEELRNMTIRFVRSFPFGRVAARCGRATVARAQLLP